MSMTDPVADMLTRIRNAVAVGHERVTMPASKLKVGIAQILVDEGYQVLTAQNGEKARECFSTEDPDLVLDVLELVLEVTEREESRLSPLSSSPTRRSPSSVAP